MDNDDLDLGPIAGDVHYARIIAYVLSTTWAVTPEVLSVIQEIVELRAAGERFTAQEIRARVEAAGPTSRGIGQVRAGAVAVVPVHGIIAHRASLMSSSTGGTSVEGIRNRMRAALQDGNISSVVLDVDSPGGSTDGIPELAAEIYDGRAQKPIVAVANAKMGSAAYWLGSQASEIVASPSASVGSIGVYGVHEDRSGQQAKRGIKTTLISAGKYKTEGHPFGPLSEDAQKSWQAVVDGLYAMFAGDVARGRGVKVDAVQNGMGEGRMVPAAEAHKLGMVDRIDTLDATVARLKAKAADAADRMYAPPPAAPSRAASRAALNATFTRPV